MKHATLFLLLCLASCAPQGPQHPPSTEVTVAAAANLADVFTELGPLFEKQTGIHPVFSFGSTAQLTRQIENAAPFDVFAAADSEHIAGLDQKGLLTPGSRAVYGIGVLALWIPPGSPGVTRLEDVASPAVRVIAVAKPELAPYGRATIDTLRRLGIWNKVEGKIAYAENIGMAKQYGASKNADAVFTAYSLVLKEPGTVIRVDEALHQPLTQELAIPHQCPHPEPARKFVDFLIHGAGKDLLARYGYRLPTR